MNVELLAVAAGSFFSVLATGFTIWALVYQRASARSAKLSADEAKLSREAAERSAIAAEEAAALSARSAEAAERSALTSEEMLEIERARDLKPTIAWVLERPTKERLRLRNTGTETATGVLIRDLDEVRQAAGLQWAPEGDDLPPGMSREMGFFQYLAQVQPSWLWIICNEQSEAVPVEIPPWL